MLPAPVIVAASLFAKPLYLIAPYPECLTKSFEELRKPKLDAWNRNKENSRAWLSLNMMTEARAGFTAFGGYKQSGIGRENHKMMLDHYQQTKNLLVSYDPKAMGFF